MLSGIKRRVMEDREHMTVARSVKSLELGDDPGELLRVRRDGWNPAG